MQINDYSEQLNKLGTISFSPNGESMWPFIKNGKSTVIVQKITDFALFDVILYKNSVGYRLHRIVKITPDYLIVCGDGLLETEKVNKTDVLGVMTEFYYKNKKTLRLDKKYLSKVKRYYRFKTIRKFKIKIHSILLKIKYKLNCKGEN